MRFLILTLIVLSFETSHAWGRRGHSIVGTNAGYLLSEELNDNFYKQHSYDLGYYANTPDFFWKEPATYDREKNQHYMDKEIFDRGLKDKKGSDPFLLSREEFEAKYSDIKVDAGRSWWRIRELDQLLVDTAKRLSQKELSKDERFGHQANWLLIAGAIGHYVGDLSQPLHVTENFDGQLTDQKGIHAFFEDTVVDELYGSLEQSTLKEAKRRWKMFHRKNANVPLVDLLKELSSNSYSDLGELLKVDKRVGRKDLKKAAQAYRPMIEERITIASLYLAEILVRQTSWTPNGERFFNFYGRPPYIEPGNGAAAPPVPTPPTKN